MNQEVDDLDPIPTRQVLFADPFKVRERRDRLRRLPRDVKPEVVLAFFQGGVVANDRVRRHVHPGFPPRCTAMVSRSFWILRSSSASSSNDLRTSSSSTSIDERMSAT